MILNEFCEYIINPLAESKARVVILPPGRELDHIAPVLQKTR